jgi:hypothetical protein
MAAVTIVDNLLCSPVEQVNHLTVANVKPGAGRFHIVGYGDWFQPQHIAVKGGSGRDILDVYGEVIVPDDP